MKSTMRKMLVGVGVCIVGMSVSAVNWAQEYSHARIVRLSFVEGAVTVQRPDIEEWAEALVNTPIQEGFKVSTAEDGFAEIEFENVSTARLGQLSLLEFTQLVLAPSGGKVNRLTLHEGYATFNFMPEDDDFYEVTAGEAKLAPNGKTRFRVDLEAGLLLVKVFKGSVEISSPEGTGTVGENAMLELRRDVAPAFQISQGITKDAWDEWVEEREGQVELVRHGDWRSAPYSNNVTSLLYGFVDLAHFGEWVMFPGYGAGWVPSVVGGWAPYTFGRWSWYPGYGYTWISSEPWGWLPYHYGQWNYQPGFGWCWLPTNLTSWSPALVNWYRGPGWVGWSPQGSPRLGAGASNCPSPSGCGAAVSEDTLRTGRPVHPGRLLGIDPTAEGRLIGRPDIEPDRLARLPGEPYRRAGVPGISQEPRQAGGVPEGRGFFGRPQEAAPPQNSPMGRRLSTSPTGEPGVSAERGASSSGIVFDPDQRRYVNGPAPVARPPEDSAQPPAPTGGDRDLPVTAPSRGVPVEARESRPVESLVGAHRPGPQGNYPSRSITPPFSRAVGAGEHVPVSPGASSHLGTQGSWSSRDRSSESSPSGRAVPDSSSRTSSSKSSHISSGRDSGSSAGSRTSVGSSQGSGGWSSGGSRGSVGSSGASVGTRSSSGGGASVGSSGGSRPSSSGRPPR